MACFSADCTNFLVSRHKADCCMCCDSVAPLNPKWHHHTIHSKASSDIWPNTVIDNLPHSSLTLMTQQQSCVLSLSVMPKPFVLENLHYVPHCNVSPDVENLFPSLSNKAPHNTIFVSRPVFVKKVYSAEVSNFIRTSLKLL